MRYFYNKRLVELLGGHFGWIWCKRFEEWDYLFKYWPVPRRKVMKRKQLQSPRLLQRERQMRFQGRGRHWLWRKKK